ncbi:Extracellular solute-binding protein, family 1 [Planktothrix tepida]|uniref:Extracellular solute-binding protein, family 1 n=3 Tax=Planktothrix TaxID=54304 RepID=A0A1J1LQZ9_9CYAN|nr:ABC transporter substrate-binding protein [Planktothrix tepida]CAD5937003.1 Extracellular solute-binding protein, family 1 [Planktothrix pseudagardhii]CAD5973371.1 Extracellular solute-binding protein, family 1 [Planktothrix tepida]CUR33985.1 Extracellular solute-binding protein, family 1 [Planktothrix tepida PCC 9214]
MRINLFSRHFARFIALLMVSFVLITCTSQSPKKPENIQQKSELTIWWNRGYYPEQDEAIEKVVENWKQVTGNQVKLSFFSEDDTLKEAITALKVGNPPDILFSERADFTLIPQWAWEGKLADVSGVMEPIQSLYEPSAIASVYLKNKATQKRSYYAIPLMEQTLHIHYWRALLQEGGIDPQNLPQNWSEFWQIWQQAQANLKTSGQTEIYGLGLPMSVESSDTYLIFEQFLIAHDVQLFDEQGNLQLDQPTVRQGIIDTLNEYTNFYLQGNVPPAAINWLNADNNTNFLNRSTIMTLNPSLSIPGSQREDQDIYQHQLVTALFPNTPKGQRMKHLVSVKEAVVFSEAQNPKLAQQFLTYLIEPKNLSAYVQGTGGRYFPVMRQLWNDPFWQNPNDPHLKVASQQFQSNKTQPLYHVINPAYAQVQTENIWGQAIKAVLTQGVSPEQATDQAIQRIKEIFDQWQQK